jgi:hypothetical protein
MVYYDICKLKECGTAFRRRLAIQFSKTELLFHSTFRSSPVARGVAKTAVTAFRRAAFLPAPLCFHQERRPFTCTASLRQEPSKNRFFFAALETRRSGPLRLLATSVNNPRPDSILRSGRGAVFSRSPRVRQVR